MFRVLTIIDSPTQKKNLLLVLQKIGMKVIDCQRKYASFLRLVQYAPHVVLFESSTLQLEDLKLIQLIKCNKQATRIPLVLIGPSIGAEQIKSLTKYGIDEYHPMPVDIKKLAIFLKTTEKNLHEKTREKLGIEVNQLSRQEEKIILNRREPLERKLNLLEGHIKKLLAFPTTVVQLIKKSEDGVSSAADLGRIIESDSAVAAEVLKLANSVYFASADHRTTSLREAIVRIGLDQTKSIVVSMTVMKHIKDENYQTGFNHREYWIHSLSVAIISGMIAEKSRIVHSDEAFVFGLLHELGVFLYNEYFNRFFLMLLDKSNEMGFPFSFFQQELMAMTHNDLMVRLCESWNFPKDFAQNFKAQDSLRLTPETVDETPYAIIAAIANSISHMLRFGHGADCSVKSIPLEVLGKLKLTTFLEEQTNKQIFDTFNLYNYVLNLGKREYGTLEPFMIDNDEITIALYESEVTWSPLRTYLELEGYRVVPVAKEQELFEVLEKDEGALFLITNYESELKTVLEHCKLYSFRGLVFDDKEMVPESYNSYGIIVTNYPADMRNVDMVIHAIHINFFEQTMTGRIGTLLPIGKNHLSAPHVMVVHPDRAIQAMMEEQLHACSVDSIEAVLDGDKAINIAKTREFDLDYIFVGYESRVVSPLDIILEIRKQTRHKRAKYILIYRNEKPDFLTLEKFSQAGIIRIIDLESSDLSQTIHTMLGKSVL